MNNETPPAPLVIVSSSPYIHSGSSVSAAMQDVLIALIPTVAAALYFFRLDALLLMACCSISAALFEAMCQRLMGRPVTVRDLSAILTGLLLSLCLPASLPLPMAIFGSFCAIVIAKQAFGGLGCNIFNPAHLGRAVLLASFPAYMTRWTLPATLGVDAVTSASVQRGVDAVTSATPLAVLRHCQELWQEGGSAVNELPDLLAMFIGNTGGSLGETCIPAILLGGLYLIWKKHIDWRVPVIYIATVAVITACYGYFIGADIYFPLYHMAGGGLMLGAFFMATDWVTSPITVRGRIIYAVGLGLLTSLIRLRGSYPEGVCYSILIMNMLSPLIDEYVINVPFGGGAQNRG